jgi:hypothetical protein
VLYYYYEWRSVRSGGVEEWRTVELRGEAAEGICGVEHGFVGVGPFVIIILLLLLLLFELFMVSSLIS